MQAINLNGSKVVVKHNTAPLPEIHSFDLQNSPSEIMLSDSCDNSKCKLIISGRARADSDYTDTTIGTNDLTEKIISHDPFSDTNLLGGLP